MSQTLYELELAHRHIEELAQSKYHYPASRPGSRPVVIQLLGRMMIRAGEALGGRQPSPVTLYTRPKAAVRVF